MNDSTACRKPKIDKALYARIAARETLRQDGVVRMQRGFADWLHLRGTPGVRVRVDGDGHVHIDVSIVVRYDVELRALGSAIQDAIAAALRGTSNPPVGRIDVLVADIERKPEESEQKEDSPE